MAGFNPKTADEAQILARASSLLGRSLGDLDDLTDAALPVVGKGSAGLLLERHFGIAANAISAPDFDGAGIELKVVPVVVGSKGQRRIKERTVISMIDYDAIVEEDWATAHVRSKLEVLLVFYEVLVDEPIEAFPILRVLRWGPDEITTPLIEHDWEAIRTKVARGHAEDLTESEGYVLGACTKGPGGGTLKPQPRSSIQAPGRAFALKPTFMLNLLLDAERQDVAELRELEELQRNYARFVDETVGSMAEEVGVTSSSAKNWAATVVRKGVVLAGRNDIEALGLTIRVPRVDPELRPYEHLSFPSFRHVELVTEDWNDSLLLSYIEYMLLAPITGPSKATLPNRCTVMAPVYWKPTAEDLALIRTEWTTFRDLIRAGNTEDLPTAASTKAIHIRTKGRDNTDLDRLPDGTWVTKKAFWLNADFVQEVLHRSIRRPA
jgi:DNA mismatch repair protein MutH